MCLAKSNEVLFRTITASASIPMRKCASKGGELQFEINDYNRRKFDAIHGIEQIEKPIVRF